MTEKMTKSMTKNAYDAKIDHVLSSVYPIHSVYLVFPVSDQIDQMTKWTKQTRWMLSKSAQFRGQSKEGCAREHNPGADLQRNGPMAHLLLLSRLCSHIRSEFEKPITRGGR